MSDWKQRTQLLIGEDGLQKLEQSHVLVVGLGGVGSYAAEALARAGVGTMTIVDGDVVDPTNKNRQLQALDSTIGQHKALLRAAGNGGIPLVQNLAQHALGFATVQPHFRADPCH